MSEETPDERSKVFAELVDTLVLYHQSPRGSFSVGKMTPRTVQRHLQKVALEDKKDLRRVRDRLEEKQTIQVVPVHGRCARIHEVFGEWWQVTTLREALQDCVRETFGERQRLYAQIDILATILATTGDGNGERREIRVLMKRIEQAARSSVAFAQSLGFVDRQAQLLAAELIREVRTGANALRTDDLVEGLRHLLTF
jgi:hypothetical protein